MFCALVQIAVHADFFSFGTNDLTQMTFGYSRDDVSKFLPSYLAKGILQHDPFEVLILLFLSPYLLDIPVTDLRFWLVKNYSFFRHSYALLQSETFIFSCFTIGEI